MTKRWVDDANAALLTDLYELKMLQAYYRETMTRPAVFSLFFRRLPHHRNFMLACGLDDVLHYLENLRFDDEALAYLANLGIFRPDFIDRLAGFRFTGAVRAVPEGTPVFPNEPLLEIEAPLPEAQLVETFVMNQVHFQTVIASKAARIVCAAAGRAVVDFGLRRMHGTDAGLKGARAFYIAGLSATSNVLAGRVWDIPIAGTMAHSYVQAHDDEGDSFRAFAEIYPDTVLLVDTYDTIEGVRKVIALASELGERFHVRAVRLDSGDLAELAVNSRRLLDDAGLARVEIFASGGLDERQIDALVRAGAPIDGFGVGTGLGVAEDAPSLDIAYKLVAYDGKDRLKTSIGKETLPGPKQVYRIEEDGRARCDVIASDREELDGRPLLIPVMESGRRMTAGSETLEQARERARTELLRLPENVRALGIATPPYPVHTSETLERHRREVVAAVAEVPPR